MEKIKSEVLISILEKNRGLLNQKFIFAQLVDRTLHPEIFSKYLINILEPIIDHYGQEDYERVEALTLELYQKILTLYAKHYLSAKGRFPLFEEVFLDLILHFRDKILAYPKIFSDLGNSVLMLSRELGERVFQWSALLKATRFDSYDTFLKTGFIAAWISGFAPYRKEALNYLDDVDISCFKTLFGLQEATLSNADVRQIKREMIENPWYHPGDFVHSKHSKPYVFKTIGGFSGFDDAFTALPSVFVEDTQLAVTDRHRSYLLFLDIFGQKLVPLEPGDPPKPEKSSSFPVQIKKGKIYFNDFPLPNLPKMNLPIKSKAHLGHTYCFTSYSSYKIFILGLPGGIQHA